LEIITPGYGLIRLGKSKGVRNRRYMNLKIQGPTPPPYYLLEANWFLETGRGRGGEEGDRARGDEKGWTRRFPAHLRRGLDLNCVPDG